ncbi:DNA modification system-associated small protein [Faecalibacter sp. LW9]|uniref:DNA modification system-associated small protein n=1 Tax=Faecalibacter sp. LW9 TaxID=3103144 RepID=UPI002AFE6D52|nr:DNA modification system-associated small protein [Faecalibacter sp. LW9]
MDKGLDAMFIHYGIRREDMAIIKNICEANDIDFDWFKDEILKEYHEIKMKNQETEEITIQKIIEKALKNK